MSSKPLPGASTSKDGGTHLGGGENNEATTTKTSEDKFIMRPNFVMALRDVGADDKIYTGPEVINKKLKF